MRVEADCSAIELELSARLDGEVDDATNRALDAHLAGCPRCSAHEEALRAVKRSIALQAAPRVHDLAPRVMGRISREKATRRREHRSLLRTGVAAAVVTALVLTSAVFRSGSEGAAVASEITRAVQAAAAGVTSYHARFDITERGWNDRVPERRFVAEMWFEAPERLRMEIRDLTPYPGRGWPTNDATLVAGPELWWLRETASCPPAALPGCAVSPEPEVRSLVHRQPFDGSTTIPTDLILPLETLAETDGLRVAGRDTVSGRDAHHVVLERWQAAPLIDSLQVAGTWREFSPTARVDLWLDSSTWFPLRFTVRGGGGELIVKTISLREPAMLDPDTFRPPTTDAARDGGFRTATRETSRRPTYLAGLDPYRSGMTKDGHRIDSFVDGMRWLKLTTYGAAEPTLATFTSEVVRLGEEGFGYYQPSSDSLRRAVEIFGADETVRVESNLPRRELLAIAGSMPVTGRSFDRLDTASGSITRIGRTALAAFDGAARPTYLPEGFRFSSAFISRSGAGRRQVVAYYRRSESAPLMGEIRITQVGDVDLLPPSSEDLLSVRAGDLTARWSPLRSELEWIQERTYRAVAVPGFDLATAVRIARGIGS